MAIIQPAATVAIFSLIFTRFMRLDTGGVPYVIFSYATMVPWTLLAASLSDMVNSLVDNMNRTPDFSAGESCRVEFMVNFPLLDSEYELGVDIASSDLRHYYDRVERVLRFWIKSTSGAKGLADLAARVNITKPAEQVLDNHRN